MPVCDFAQRLTGGYQLRALLAIAPVRARPSAHFGFASTLRQNVWYPQVVGRHAKSKIARKYVHVFAGKGKTGKPRKTKREIGRRDRDKNHYCLGKIQLSSSVLIRQVFLYQF